MVRAIYFFLREKKDMKSAGYFSHIFICNLQIDFRKSIDGLSVVVESELKQNLFDKNLFIFFNRRRDKVKILYWDKSGFALWMKRLEKENFKLKFIPKTPIVSLSKQEFELLLDGFDIWKTRPHLEVKISRVY
jgi:transposase